MKKFNKITVAVLALLLALSLFTCADPVVERNIKAELLAAKSGDTVSLDKDYIVGENLDIRAVNLDLKGFTLKINGKLTFETTTYADTQTITAGKIECSELYFNMPQAKLSIAAAISATNLKVIVGESSTSKFNGSITADTFTLQYGRVQILGAATFQKLLISLPSDYFKEGKKNTKLELDSTADVSAVEINNVLNIENYAVQLDIKRGTFGAVDIKSFTAKNTTLTINIYGGTVESVIADAATKAEETVTVNKLGGSVGVVSVTGTDPQSDPENPTYHFKVKAVSKSAESLGDTYTLIIPVNKTESDPDLILKYQTGENFRYNVSENETMMGIIEENLPAEYAQMFEIIKTYPIYITSLALHAEVFGEIVNYSVTATLEIEGFTIPNMEPVFFEDSMNYVDALEEFLGINDTMTSAEKAEIIVSKIEELSETSFAEADRIAAVSFLTLYFDGDYTSEEFFDALTDAAAELDTRFNTDIFSSFVAELINAEETDNYTDITEIDDRVFETDSYTVTVSLKMV